MHIHSHILTKNKNSVPNVYKVSSENQTLPKTCVFILCIILILLTLK